MRRRKEEDRFHNHEKTKKLLELSEVSLLLDSYNDIFSSFDPRPYSQRAMSQDFLDEAKRASRDKMPDIELSFLLPKSKRNKSQELVIKKRLHEHFRKHTHRLEQETKALVKKGVLFVVFGVIFMIAASMMMFRDHQATALINFFIIFLEPASWFLFWEGLSILLFDTKKLEPDRKFYMKMSKCGIHFSSY